MKLKNIICLVLVIVMALATLNVSAAKNEIELFINGGCESQDLAIWWSAASGSGVSAEQAKTGKYSYKLPAPSATSQAIGSIQFEPFEGATYTTNVQVYVAKKDSAESYPMLTMVFMDDDKVYLDRADLKLEGCSEGKWHEMEVSGVAPKNATIVQLIIRTNNGGTYFWDDASLKVSGDKKIMQAYQDKLELEQRLLDDANASLAAQNEKAMNSEMIEGTNVVKNGGFEDGDGVAATHWNGYNGEWGPVTARTNEEARSGEYSMKIDTRNVYANYGPYAGQSIYIEDGLIPGQQYVFTAWVKVKQYTRGGGAYMKMEPYNARTSSLNAMLTTVTTDCYTWEDVDPNGEQWHPLKLLIEVEEETKLLTFIIRLKHSGIIYYDDVSLGLADGGSRFDLYPARVFNYIEEGYGTAVAEVNTTGFALVPNSNIDFKVKDGNTVLESASVPASSKVIWNFDLNKMPEELKAYTLEATYKDAQGNPIGSSVSARVYKTHRPTKLNENGNYIDTNGEIFYPVIGYGKPDDYWQESDVHGVNVFKPWIESKDLTNLEKGLDMYEDLLDKGAKEGVKFVIQFGASEPTGYPGLATDRMNAFLDRFANHPAIFAYFLIDEVSLKIKPTNKIKTYDYMQKWLEEGYVQVRSKDTVNPIYLLDTGTRADMERSSRIGDIFATDPYPRAESSVPGYAYIRSRWATLGSEQQTPVSTIVQMTPFAEENWRPSATAIRHQYYQAFWAGAKMIGFFSFTGSSDMILESLKDIPERYEDFCKFYQTGEQEIAFRHFTTPDTILIANWQENDVWYRIWQDPADGQNYLLVMNMHASEYEADIKLVSNNGKISFDGYTAQLVNGTGLEETVTSADNKFRLKMPSLGVGLYRLQPNTPVDVSKLSDDAYADIAGFDWAEKEIETLAMKDVVNEINGAFAPGENITRADFAGFLIRSLGLTADASSTFDDIDPNHTYAKEIAMGKALGILTGVGNNLYNPNEAISRQDVMTICSRGMEIAKVLDTTGSLVRLNNFTDKDLFADYAALHASKMVIEGVVKGNPDQTINPLGNTTRAEAAVMMYRIIYKGQIKTKA